MFWTDDPNILLNPKYLFEICPVPSRMTFEQELNALTRLLVLISIVVFFRSGMNLKTVIICALTLFSVFLYYKYDVFHQSINKGGGGAGSFIREGYVGGQEEKEEDSDVAATTSTKTPTLTPTYRHRANDVVLLAGSLSTQPLFDQSSSTNPFSNVLVTDYEDNPHKKPAEPSHNDDYRYAEQDQDGGSGGGGGNNVVMNKENDIIEKAKQMVLENNPGNVDLAEKLFTDMGDKYVFEQSLRPFYSNASTTIPNDQRGFAEFCYGNMISCKEGNLFSCARNLPNATIV